jgi:dTDP-4-dehydrorhamnose reductase
MRWLITGATGMVGSDLHAALKSRDFDTVAFGHAELDITNGEAVLYALKQTRPDLIVNCAAFTRVDEAEAAEAEARRVNGTAVGFLAEGANRWNALLVQLSTDFVFDGSATRPYEVSDRTAPLSAYARSKLAGEEAARSAARHLILRTSWLFGRRGANFVEAIRRQIASGRRELRVVNDQRGRPTYTPHLAEAIIRVAQIAVHSSEGRGVVQYADSPECTWFDFAREIVEALGAEVEVHPVSTAEFPRPARRPQYSVLSTERYERLTGAVPESWPEGLREYLSLDAGAPDTRHSLPLP